MGIIVLKTSLNEQLCLEVDTVQITFFYLYLFSISSGFMATFNRYRNDINVEIFNLSFSVSVSPFTKGV